MVFEHFPKVRTPLPEDYQKIFQKHYIENREGATRSSSITKWMESWMHKQVAADVRTKSDGAPTLEIGAGTLNHLVYEPLVRPYDVVEPNDVLVSCFPKRRLGVRSVYKNTNEIKGEKIYQRIISIATFEHVLDLPVLVAKIGILLRDEGVLRVAIPNEGRFLWKIGYRLTNGIEFRLRYNLDYDKIMQHEHVNTADEVALVLEYFFERTRLKLFGLGKDLSFYRFYECSLPRKERCFKIFNQEAGIF